MKSCLKRLWDIVVGFAGFVKSIVSGNNGEARLGDFYAVLPFVGRKKVSIRVIAKELGIQPARSNGVRFKVFRALNDLGLQAERLDNPKHIRVLVQ